MYIGTTALSREILASGIGIDVPQHPKIHTPFWSIDQTIILGQQGLLFQSTKLSIADCYRITGIRNKNISSCYQSLGFVVSLQKSGKHLENTLLVLIFAGTYSHGHRNDRISRVYIFTDSPSKC